MYNTRFIIFGLVVLVIVGGGVGAVLSKRKPYPMQQAGTLTNIVPPTNGSGESCSPPGTPTCGPDGKSVTVNKPGAETTDVKTLSSIPHTKIQLSGSGTEGLDIDKQTGYVYALNNGNIISGCEGDVTQSGGRQEPGKGAGTLSIIDPASGKEIANVNSEMAPIWPLVDDQRKVLYAAGSGNGKVAVHELGTGKKLDSITVGGKPHAFGLSPSGVLIVSNTNDDTQTYMAAIDAKTKKLIAHHKAPEFPHGIAYDTKNDAFYLVGVKQGDIAVVNAKTGEVKSTMVLDEKFKNSNMLAFSEKTRQLFVSDTQQQSSVTVVNVDTQKIVGHIAWSNQMRPAWGMDVDDEAGLLYAALPNADAIGIADVATLKPLATVPVDTCPYAVKLDTARGLGFSTGQVNGTLSIFDIKKVVEAVRQ